MDNRVRFKILLDVVSVLAAVCILVVMIVKDPTISFDIDRTIRMWTQTILCSLFMFITYVSYISSDLDECNNVSLVENIKASTGLASFVVGVFLIMTLYEALPVVWSIL